MSARAYLTGAITAEVTATLCLKGALMHPWLYAVVIAGYVASFTFLHHTLRAGMGVGTAYGIWGAVGVVATAGLSHLIFGEALTAMMAAGMALIVAGVVCVEMGSK